MKIKSFTFNPFQENTFVLYDTTKECIIIDPGCYTTKEQKILQKFIITHSLKPTKLINTHCHIDHILGNKFVSNEWNIELYVNKRELPLLEKSREISEMYGFDQYKMSPYPKHFLDHGDTLEFGENTMKVLFTPGHSPGHICLYSQTDNLLIAGDVIFQRSIGRTDLPGGNHKTLIESINREIISLPEKTQIFCGHGPSTILELEKKINPFIQ